MIDKMIASIQVRDDDDVVSGHIEVVEDTDDKYGDTPVRVRHFERNSPTGYYQTWYFENRVDGMSHAMTLAGYGPLMADNDVTSDSSDADNRRAWIKALMSGGDNWANVPAPKEGMSFLTWVLANEPTLHSVVAGPNDPASFEFKRPTR